MFLISPLIDFYCRIRGPKFAFKIYLSRLERWRTFEPEYYLLDHLVDPTRASIDIGANEGIYSGRIAQLCPRVHSFEPIPWFAAQVREKLDSKVIVHQVALSNKSGFAKLRIPYRNDVEMHGTSTLEDGNPLPGSTHIKLVDCKLERLDDVVSEAVGFVKLDVEGHEHAVLEGAVEIIRRDRPVFLIETERRHNAEAPESVFKFMTSFGYAGFFLRNGRLWALSAFDAERDQIPENVRNVHVDQAQTKPYAPYINNFIFIPG